MGYSANYLGDAPHPTNPMNRFSYLLISVLVIFLWACTSMKEATLESGFSVKAENTYTLSSKGVKANSIPPGYIVELNVIENHLVAMGVFGSFLYAVADLATGSTFTLGNIGEGPNEVRIFTLLQTYSADGETRVKAYNSNKQRIEDFAWKEVVRTKQLSFDTTRLNRKPLRSMKMVYLKSINAYLSEGTFPQKRFSVFSTQGKVLQEFGEYPFEADFKNVSPENLAMAFQVDFETNNSGTHIAAAAANSACIDFFKVVDGKVVPTRQHHISKPEFEPSKNANELSATVKQSNKMGFISTASDKDYVYVLYSGKSIAEGLDEAMTGNSVYVYDWEGNLRHKLLLDKKVHFITVNPQTRQLLAVINGETTQFVSFELPKFKK